MMHRHTRNHFVQEPSQWRQCYKVMSPLIGWVHTWNDPWHVRITSSMSKPVACGLNSCDRKFQNLSLTCHWWNPITMQAGLLFFHHLMFYIHVSWIHIWYVVSYCSKERKKFFTKKCNEFDLCDSKVQGMGVGWGVEIQQNVLMQ